MNTTTHPLNDVALRQLATDAQSAHAALTQLMVGDPTLTTNPHHLSALHTYDAIAKQATYLLRHWRLTARSRPDLIAAWTTALNRPPIL